MWLHFEHISISFCLPQNIQIWLYAHSKCDCAYYFQLAFDDS